MDQERFDAITRTLASGISRRGVLRTLGGVSAGGVLAVVGRGTVAARGGNARMAESRAARARFSMHAANSRPRPPHVPSV